MGPQGALGLQKFFSFWAYTTPIGGAILADQYWGRYKTIVWGCVLYVVGETVLVLTSMPLKSISTGSHIGGFISSIIIIGLGTGGTECFYPQLNYRYQIERQCSSCGTMHRHHKISQTHWGGTRHR